MIRFSFWKMCFFQNILTPLQSFPSGLGLILASWIWSFRSMECLVIPWSLRGVRRHSWVVVFWAADISHWHWQTSLASQQPFPPVIKDRCQWDNVMKESPGWSKIISFSDNSQQFQSFFVVYMLTQFYLKGQWPNINLADFTYTDMVWLPWQNYVATKREKNSVLFIHTP